MVVGVGIPIGVGTLKRSSKKVTMSRSAARRTGGRREGRVLKPTIYRPTGQGQDPKS